MTTDTEFYCSECDADVGPDDKFCPQCGEPLDDHKEPVGFCEEIDELPECPHCGAPVNGSDRECMFCRKSLRPVAARSPLGCVSVILAMIGVSIAVGFVAYFTFFLVDVPAGHIGVKEVLGPPLDPAQRFLPARREILPAGRHVINPFLYEVEVVECVEVPHGHIGVIKDKDGKLRPLRPGQYNLPADEVKIIDLSKYKFFIMEDGIQVQPAHEAPPGTPAEIEEGFDFDFTWEPPDFTPEQVDKLKLNVSEYPSWSIK